MVHSILPNERSTGFEGLTVSGDGRTLFALLQSAAIQDGGGDKSTNRYTRLFAWDISTPGGSQLTGACSADASKILLIEVPSLGKQGNGSCPYRRARRERRTRRVRFMHSLPRSSWSSVEMDTGTETTITKQNRITSAFVLLLSPAYCGMSVLIAMSGFRSFLP